ELLGRVRTSPHERPPEWERLGVVPQEIALYPRLTARENLSIFGGLSGLSGDDLASRVADALIWTGLEERANDQAGGFSGGMKRRLNIACGVLHDPQVVLLDEPTVGVDPQSRERIWTMLADLHGRGRTLLLTTHQLDEAERVCQRIVVIDAGKTAAEGTMDELIRGLPPEKAAARALLTLDGAPPAELGLTVRPDGRVERPVESLEDDLPKLLRSLADAGLTVADLEVRRPDLQEVFLHLTGRTLRE
ncbi:MAG: ABC transporter ATP-binding protein, partial [Planctomycetota bacterium]